MELLFLLISVPGLLTKQCGQAREELHQLQPGTEAVETSLDRIVNGQTATPHAIPWQAWVFQWNRVTTGSTLLGLLVEMAAFANNPMGYGYCGGSLISEYYAHYVTIMSFTNLLIVFFNRPGP